MVCSESESQKVVKMSFTLAIPSPLCILTTHLTSVITVDLNLLTEWPNC